MSSEYLEQAKQKKNKKATSYKVAINFKENPYNLNALLDQKYWKDLIDSQIVIDNEAGVFYNNQTGKIIEEITWVNTVDDVTPY